MSEELALPAGQPFPIKPTKGDLQADLAGAPIPDLFTYQCRPATEAEATAATFNATNLPLSTLGYANFRDDKKIF